MQACKFKEKPKTPADPSINVAVWLVPTAGVLFGLVGYVIDSAHRSLLAFPTDDGRLDDGGRVQDAADFLRFLFMLIGDRLLTLVSLKGFSLGGHALMLLGWSLLVTSVLAASYSREPERKGLRSTASVLKRSLPYLVVALISVKFVYFDAPAMRIESVVVDVGVPEVAVARATASAGGASSASPSALAASALTRPLADRLKGNTPAPVSDLVSERAYELWRLMACSRIGGEKINLGSAVSLASSARCDHGDDKLDVLPKRTAQNMLAGEFDAALLLGVLIVVTAVALLMRRSIRSSTLAVLALAYLLTLPYAWGKLLKPVDFSYARIRGIDGTFLVTDGDGIIRDAKSAYAFVLGRDSGSVTLLQGIRELCSNGSSTALRFSSVPAAKIVAIEQIFRLDVIEWALRTQDNCPTAGEPQPAN